MATEAEKFFESLPSEANTETFNLQETLKQEKEVPQVQEEPKPENEEVTEPEEESPRRMNRQERRREQNKFWEEQMAKKDQMLEQLQTELLKRSQTNETKEETDARLTRLFGDTPQGKEASRIVSELLKETEERAVSPYRQLEQQQQAEAQQEQQFERQIEEGLDSVYDAYGIDLDSRSMKDTRNAFLDFVDELSPEDGFVNFEKAWSLFQANNKAPKDPEVTQRKKDIASRSMQRTTTARPEGKPQPLTFDRWDSIKAKLLGKN